MSFSKSIKRGSINVKSPLIKSLFTQKTYISVIYIKYCLCKLTRLSNTIKSIRSQQSTNLPYQKPRNFICFLVSFVTFVKFFIEKYYLRKVFTILFAELKSKLKNGGEA